MKDLEIKIEGELSWTMVGYDTHFDLLDKIKKQRPDIDVTQLRELIAPLKMHISYGKYNFTLHFKEGFVFDTATVPNILKAIIDNDSSIMLIPSLFHDAAFGLHFFDFKTTNKIFRAMIKYFGKKYKVKFRRLRAFIAWLGVNSFVGKRIFYNTLPAKHFNFGKVSIEYNGND